MNTSIVFHHYCVYNCRCNVSTTRIKKFQPGYSVATRFIVNAQQFYILLSLELMYSHSKYVATSNNNKVCIALPTAWINDGIGFDGSIKWEFHSSSIDNSDNIASSRCFDNGEKGSFQAVFGI